jgi:hypothetical protein
MVRRTRPECAQRKNTRQSEETESRSPETKDRADGTQFNSDSPLPSTKIAIGRHGAVHCIDLGK